MQDQEQIYLDDFRGLYDWDSEATVPPNYFLDCLNLEFGPKFFRSRTGVSTVESDGDQIVGTIIRMKRYEIPGEEDRIIYLESGGDFFDSTDTLTPILSVPTATDFAMVSLYGRAYISPSNGIYGIVDEAVYVYDPDDINPARPAAGAPPGGFVLNAASNLEPTEVDDPIVTNVAAADGPLVLTSAPDPYEPPTPTTVLLNRTAGTITTITFTIVGFDEFKHAQTRTYTDVILSATNIEQYVTPDIFSSITSITISNYTGVGGFISVAASGQPPGKIDKGIYVLAVAYETDSGFITRPGPAVGNSIQYKVLDVVLSGKAIRVGDASGVANPFVDPTSITGLTYWTAGDKLPVIADNDPIPQLTDFSGLANHWNAAGALRGTYQTNGYNTLPIFRMTTANAYTGPIGNLLFSDASNTVFIVYKSVGNSNSYYMSKTGAAGTSPRFGELSNQESFNIGASVVLKNITYNQYNTVTFLQNSGNISIGINDTTDAGLTTAPAPASTGLTSAYRFGGPNGGLVNFSGDFAEIIIYNVVLNEDQRLLVQAYLNEKYLNIPIPPDSVDVVPPVIPDAVKIYILSSKPIPADSYTGNPNDYELFFVPASAGGVIEGTTVATTINFFAADLVDSADRLKDNLARLPAGVALLATSKGRLCIVGINPETAIDGIENVGQIENDTVLYASTGGEPEAFSGTDGFVIIKPGGAGLKNITEYRGLIYPCKSTRSYVTRDTGDLPSTWEVETIDDALGTECHGISVALGSDSASEDVTIIATRAGLYAFNGTYSERPLTWQIRSLWETLIGDDFHKIEVAVDPTTKSIFVAVPFGEELDTQPAPHPFVLYGDFSDGLSWESIKWSPWKFEKNIGEMEPQYASRIPYSIFTGMLNGVTLLYISLSVGTPFTAAGIYSYQRGDGVLLDGDTDPIPYIWESAMLNYSQEGGVSQLVGIRYRMNGSCVLRTTIAGPNNNAPTLEFDKTIVSLPTSNQLIKTNYVGDDISITTLVRAIDGEEAESFMVNRIWYYGNQSWLERPY